MLPNRPEYNPCPGYTPAKLLHRASCLVATVAALCHEADNACEAVTLDQACDLIHEAMDKIEKLKR